MITSGVTDKVLRVNASNDKKYESKFYGGEVLYIWCTLYFANNSKVIALCSKPFMDAIGTLEEVGEKRNQQVAKFLGSKAQRNQWVCAFQGDDEGYDFYTIQRMQSTADVTYEE